MAEPFKKLLVDTNLYKRYNTYKVIPAKELTPCPAGIVAEHLYPVGFVPRRSFDTETKTTSVKAFELFGS
jgi:hypothetical protein